MSSELETLRTKRDAAQADLKDHREVITLTRDQLEKAQAELADRKGAYEALKEHAEKLLGERDAAQAEVKALRKFNDTITTRDQINFGNLLLERDALKEKVERLEKRQTEVADMVLKHDKRASENLQEANELRPYRDQCEALAGALEKCATNENNLNMDGAELNDAKISIAIKALAAYAAFKEGRGG